MKKWIKIIVGALLLIVLVAVIWKWVYIKTTTKDQVFILPQNFKGIVLIAYGQQNGLRDVEENGKLIYKVPASGVVKLKRREVTTLSSTLYYMENGKGGHVVLDYCIPPCEEMKSDTSKTFAFGGGNMVFYGEQSELKTSIFLVGTANDTDSLSKAAENMNAIEIIKNSD